jgi:hypothetical protein
MWVRVPDYVRLVDGVDYDQVATELLDAAGIAASIGSVKKSSVPL